MHQKPSPMRGRWHGEAVTDEVEALASTRRCPPHQSPPATASPHRGSLWPAAAGRQSLSQPRVYLKTPNAPGQRTFSRCAAPFFLEIRQYSCEKMSCSAQKFLAAGHIGSFQIHPSALFSPIFSRAREKIGPPEARQKRPRRNEPPQATSLILCARFFLSKPQTEFAVWGFSMQICGSLSVSFRLPAPLQGEPCVFRQFCGLLPVHG